MKLTLFAFVFIIPYIWCRDQDKEMNIGRHKSIRSRTEHRDGTTRILGKLEDATETMEIDCEEISLLIESILQNKEHYIT